MLLKEWLKSLENMIKRDPNLLDYEIITASDDEGNDFNAVVYTPSIGIWTEEDEYIPEDQIDEDQKGGKVICLN